MRVHSRRKSATGELRQPRRAAGPSAPPPRDGAAGHGRAAARSRREPLAALDWSRRPAESGTSTRAGCSAEATRRARSTRSPWSRTVLGGRSAGSSGPVGEALQRLWRHSVAVSIAARTLAREAGDPDPDGLPGRGSFTVWAVGGGGRRSRVDRRAGSRSPSRAIGRRWSCGPRHRPVRPRPPAGRALGLRPAGRRRRLAPRPVRRRLNRVAVEPRRLGDDPGAFRWAEKTPWALAPDARAGVDADRASAADPGCRGPVPLRLALRRGRCHSPRESDDPAERRLMLELWRRPAQPNATRDRLLQARCRGRPRGVARGLGRPAARLWCDEPEVTAARVVWTADPRAARPTRGRGGYGPSATPTAGTLPTARQQSARPLILPLRIAGPDPGRGPSLVRRPARRPPSSGSTASPSSRLVGLGLPGRRPQPPGATAAGPRRGGRQDGDEEDRLRDGKLRRPGRIRGGRGPRAEQSARRDRRPCPVAAGPDRPTRRPADRCGSSSARPSGRTASSAT